MVGGGNRRDEGSFTVSNTNVFAALDTRKKRKDKGSSKGTKTGAAGKSKAQEEKQVFWAPAPLTVKSWADVDDEDDDDYYATTAPPQAIWAGSGVNRAQETEKPDPVEESETEDELLDEVDDDVEEEHDHETEVQENPQPIVNKPVEASLAPKETERQLSKKERKKKELAELEAILADFGVTPKEKAESETSEINKNEKEGQDAVEKKDNAAPVESKSAKKKKKKDKASKEAQNEANSSNAANEQEETAETGRAEEDASAVDVKERLKKVVAAKKKKSNKELDAAARAAALEAAARSAKLAAAKKKEKNHYNQQPIR